MSVWSLPSRGGSQLTLASQWESKKVMTSPLAAPAPSRRVLISPSLFLVLRIRTFGKRFMYSSSATFRCSEKMSDFLSESEEHRGLDHPISCTKTPIIACLVTMFKAAKCQPIQHLYHLKHGSGCVMIWDRSYWSWTTCCPWSELYENLWRLWRYTGSSNPNRSSGPGLFCFPNSLATNISQRLITEKKRKNLEAQVVRCIAKSTFSHHSLTPKRPNVNSFPAPLAPPFCSN